jgi:outer membrane receptor protein involved in Fe transport
VRGLPASTARNYFRWSVPTESALLDRIEDSRGPNSVLFGIASPGGLINSMTKQAQGGRAFRKTSFTLMSYDSYRGTLDLNQPMLDGRLAFRLNAVYNKTNTFRHWQFQQSQIGHLAAKYDISDRTRIRAEFERGQVDSNQPRNYLEGGWYRSLTEDQSDTGRMMLSTQRDAGKWGHYRIAGLGEYEKAFSVGVVSHESWMDPATGLPAFNPTPENAQNRVYRRNYPTERDWASYHISGPDRDGLLSNVFDPVTGRTLSSTWSFPGCWTAWCAATG